MSEIAPVFSLLASSLEVILMSLCLHSLNHWSECVSSQTALRIVWKIVKKLGVFIGFGIDYGADTYVMQMVTKVSASLVFTVPYRLSKLELCPGS